MHKDDEEETALLLGDHDRAQSKDYLSSKKTVASGRHNSQLTKTEAKRQSALYKISLLGLEEQVVENILKKYNRHTDTQISIDFFDNIVLVARAPESNDTRITQKLLADDSDFLRIKTLATQLLEESISKLEKAKKELAALQKEKKTNPKTRNCSPSSEEKALEAQIRKYSSANVKLLKLRIDCCIFVTSGVNFYD